MKPLKVILAVIGTIILLFSCVFWWQLAQLPATPLPVLVSYSAVLLCFAGSVVLLAWLLGIWGSLHCHQE